MEVLSEIRIKVRDIECFFLSVLINNWGRKIWEMLDFYLYMMKFFKNVFIKF